MAEPVIGHIEHLSLESLVKMDRFQKEPPLNLKVTTWGTSGVERGSPKETDGNSAQTEAEASGMSAKCQ